MIQAYAGAVSTGRPTVTGSGGHGARMAVVIEFVAGLKRAEGLGMKPTMGIAEPTE